MLTPFGWNRNAIGLMKHTLYTVWVPIVRFPGHVYHAVCNADFNTHLRYLLLLFSLGFTFFCRECWVGWCFSPSVPWGCKGFSSFYLCVSFLGAAAQEGSMLNASLLLHLPCTSLQPEVGTAWPLWSKGLGNWVAVAGLNPSRSSLGSQVLPHPTELSLYHLWSCCSPAMFGLGT